MTGRHLSRTDMARMSDAAAAMAAMAYAGPYRPMAREIPRRGIADPLAVLRSCQPLAHHAVAPGAASRGLAFLHGTYGGAFAPQLAAERITA